MMLFAAYFLLNRNEQHENEIVVTANDIDNLVYTWLKKWNRPPSNEELNDLIKGFVEEEILMREAVALGLDEGDNIVRRRLAQKMQFIMDDGDTVPPPTESELIKYYEENREQYGNEPHLSFYQITIADNSEIGMRRADGLKEKILNKPDTTGVLDLGDRTLLPFDIDDYNAEKVDRTFGTGFSEQISEASQNQWEGPLASGLGIHFIYLYKKQAAGDSDFNTVKEKVKQDWVERQKRKIKTKKMEELFAKYKVRTELDQWLNATTSLK